MASGWLRFTIRPDPIDGDNRWQPVWGNEPASWEVISPFYGIRTPDNDIQIFARVRYSNDGAAVDWENVIRRNRSPAFMQRLINDRQRIRQTWRYMNWRVNKGQEADIPDDPDEQTDAIAPIRQSNRGNVNGNINR